MSRTGAVWACVEIDDKVFCTRLRVISMTSRDLQKVCSAGQQLLFHGLYSDLGSVFFHVDEIDHDIPPIFLNQLIANLCNGFRLMVKVVSSGFSRTNRLS